MTVEWLMKILSSTSYIDKNNNDHNFLPNSNTKSIIPTPDSPVRPILSSGTNNNNNYYPSDYGADFKERQASLPVFSQDYPAYFVLILLVTLTSFALFVLLFLCCLDGKDLTGADEERGDLPVLSNEEEEPEPPAKDVATETDPSPEDSNSLVELDSEPTEVEDVVEIENETMMGADEEDAVPAEEEEAGKVAEETDEKPAETKAGS